MLESHILTECANVDFDNLDGDDESISDPRKALLHFMAVATPHQHVVDDIANRFPEIIENMYSTVETHLVGDHAVVMELIDNVPDTVNPVKAKLTYVQVPDIETGSTALRLAWRVSAGNAHQDSCH
jgi:extracellular elastinolytic metalloproteinase